MQYKAIFFFFNLFIFASCGSDTSSNETENCIITALNTTYGYTDLLDGIPSNLFTALTEQPNTLGALGRNKEGYFHVRFQLNITRLTDYAIQFESTEALTSFIKSVEYAFSFQKPEGDFQFSAPNYLLNSPDYMPPSEAALASGTAFFAYSLGISLQSIMESKWYQTASFLEPIRQQIEALKPKIESMLSYLKKNKDILYMVDSKAPNRLLFNAIAFYSLGRYLHQIDTQDIGLGFANKAMAQRDVDLGYFIEGGGWDSSYNGVALQLGLEFFSLIPTTDLTTKSRLQEALSCAAAWQKSRILASGEISTEGNTRVFPGGETFLGNEKGVDVIKTVRAFFYMSKLSGLSEYDLVAKKIVNHYQ